MPHELMGMEHGGGRTLPHLHRTDIKGVRCMPVRQHIQQQLGGVPDLLDGGKGGSRLRKSLQNLPDAG